jgi:hypothetical protein
VKKAEGRPKPKGIGSQRNGKPNFTLQDELRALASEIPMSDWKKIPTDLSGNHDYYFYGMPKRFSKR